MAGEIIVEILDVDIANKTVHCRDKTNGTFQASFRNTGVIFRIPNQGDRWLASRIGYQWQLQTRLETFADEDILSNLDPGDARILAGSLLLKLDSLEFNNQPFGPTTRDVFYSAGATAFTLSSAPVHVHTIQAFDDGSLVDPNSYTLSGRVVTFNTSRSGTIVFYYQRWGRVFEDATTVTSSGTPSATGSFTHSGSPTTSP